MNSKESLIYTKYKTISMLPEEILEAYYDKATFETIEMLYGKMKNMLLELPAEEAENLMERMARFLQTVLVGKEKYASKIKVLMNPSVCSYSDNFKWDKKIFQKVRKYFSIPDTVELIVFLITRNLEVIVKVLL